ncbi:MAG: ABC transporter ATP-binding protein [Pseudomonadota bacterium]
MLEIHQIDVFYGDLQTLWSVSFTVEEREIVAIIGSNGAGKSTILKTLAGLLRPVRGSISLKGMRLDKLSPDRRVLLGICLVPEGRGLFAGMSILENLELGAFNSAARSRKEETLKYVYQMFPILGKRKRQAAGTLSGGEQQMVAIARGLMSRPKILLLDEPSLGLAPLITKCIFETIEQVNKSEVTIVLVEQNVRMSLELANRAYIVENGRIVGSGDAKCLFHDQRVKEAYLGVEAI